MAKSASTKLDIISGVRPGARPAHLAQLDAVLTLAAQQASQVELNPAAVDRDADLWNLREPGYLRAICDHPVTRPSNVLVLLPVVFTWGALGYAEWRYAGAFATAETTARPSFFADWIAQPWYLGPVALSLVIVASVLWIMGNYGRAAAAQRRADRIDRVVHRLEVDLLPELATLRTKLGPVTAEEHTMRAAVELAAAARRFGAASDRLGAATSVVDGLGVVVDRMVTSLPNLRIEVDRLGDLQQRLDHSTTEITHQLQPLTTVVADVAGAADAARDAAAQSESAVRQAALQTAETKMLAGHNGEHRDALAQAQRPFTEAADAVAAAAGKLEATAGLMQDTAGRLKETIREVNWLAMVSDGLRDAEDNHGAEPGAVAG